MGVFIQSYINENKSSITSINNNVNTNTTEISTLKDKNSFLDAYPVGSIYISKTNTNPGTIYGGTWKLVDKRFKNLWGTYSATSNTDVTMFTKTSKLSNYAVSLMRVGNTIRIRLHLDPAVEFADSTLELGTFNLSNLGVTNLGADYLYVLCGSDEANGIAQIVISYDTGEVEVRDVVTKTSGGTIAADSNLYCDFTVTANQKNILDSAAGEFHFERTA